MNENHDAIQLSITRLQNSDEARACAELMSSSKPWITIGRTYEQSLNIISDTAKEVYLACVQDDFAGFLILNMQGAFVGYIQTICLRPEWRNQGLGRRLIQFAEKRIFRESPNVFMCVSSFNQDAYRLYKRLGTKPSGS